MSSALKFMPTMVERPDVINLSSPWIIIISFPNRLKLPPKILDKRKTKSKEPLRNTGNDKLLVIAVVNVLTGSVKVLE